MWQKKLLLRIQECEWKNIYVNNFKTPRYKKFSEFKYKILHNILACNDKLSKWKKIQSSACVVCNEKEDISHLLYNCPRIKLIWNILSNCLNLNIQLKHIILGIECDNYVSKNKFICIIIVSYTIYSNWYKTRINNGNYWSSNIKELICQQLTFYCDVYQHVVPPKQWRNLTRFVKCILYHLK